MYSMLEMNVNWLAVLVTAIGYMAIGALWYGPLFQKLWMQLTGVTEESVKAGAAKAYAIMFVVALVSVFVLAMFVLTLDAAAFIDGLIIGFFVWVGFQATVMLNPVIFEKRPFRLFLINAGYNLVTLLAAGGVLAIWQ